MIRRFALVLVLLLPLGAQAAPPKDFAGFQQAVEAARADPEATAKLFVHALLYFVRDAEEGESVLTLLIRPDDLYKDTERKTGWRLSRDVRSDFKDFSRRDFITESYCGGTPAARYQDADLAQCPIQLDKEYSATRQGVGFPRKGRAKFFVANGGSGSPRPIELELGEDGAWKVRNFYGLLHGVAAPAE